MLLRRVFQTPHFLLASFYFCFFFPLPFYVFNVLVPSPHCSLVFFFSFTFSSLPTLLYHKHIYLGVCQPCFFFRCCFHSSHFFFPLSIHVLLPELFTVLLLLFPIFFCFCFFFLGFMRKKRMFPSAQDL